MPKASSFSPLRLFSPIQLVVCFVLFFLPWIEIQCVPPKSAGKDMPKEQLEAFRKETGIDPTKPISYLTQSGLQIATGEASPGSDIKKIADKQKKEGRGEAGALDFDPDAKLNKNKKEEGTTAPLLFLYPIALLAGIIIAFIPMPSMVRRLVLAGCCAGAIGVIGLQAAIGFPLEKKLKESIDKQKEMTKQLGGAAGKGDTEPTMRVSWQIPLYLTFLLLLGATGTAFLDGGGGGGRKPKRAAYDFEDEDEDDDQPKKKKKRVVEDDEEEEEEKPKAKKKPKPLELDDEDEDERPKKKKKRRDDEE